MSTCLLETCPAKAGKQIKEQAAYNVGGFEVDFYHAVTGQTARWWSLISAHCHVWSCHGLVKVRQQCTCQLFPPFCSCCWIRWMHWMDRVRQLRNRRNYCSAVWVIVSTRPIQHSTLIHLRIAVCAATWLTAQSSNGRLKRVSVTLVTSRAVQPPGNSWLVSIIGCFVYFLLMKSVFL